MGRKRTPTKLKILKGTDQKCRMNPDEPQPDPNIPPPPEHLDTYAIMEWGRITPDLFRLGILSDIDRGSLAAYCQAYSRWRKTEEELAQSSILVKTTNGNIIQNPLVGIANKSMEMMIKIASEFGMTPASRSKVSAKKKDKPASQWSKVG